jgi:hypothetical protein
MADKKMRRVRKALLVAVVFTACARLIHAQCSSTHPLQRPVAVFSANHVSMVEALLRLGQEQHVCFGIEYVDSHSLLDSISVLVNNATVDDVVREIVSHGKGYDFKQVDGIILVTNAGLPHGNKNLFDHVVPLFSTPRASVQEANNALWMQVQVDLNPTITGFAGHYPTGDREDIIDPIEEHLSSVRHLLNLIVGRSKGSSWIARVGQDQLSDVPPSGVWQILEYNRPIAEYANQLNEIGKQILERERKGP